VRASIIWLAYVGLSGLYLLKDETIALKLIVRKFFSIFRIKHAYGISCSYICQRRNADGVIYHIARMSPPPALLPPRPSAPHKSPSSFKKFSHRGLAGISQKVCELRVRERPCASDLLNEPHWPCDPALQCRVSTRYSLAEELISKTLTKSGT
jgi:hypothetical protein